MSEKSFATFKRGLLLAVVGNLVAATLLLAAVATYSVVTDLDPYPVAYDTSGAHRW